MSSRGKREGCRQTVGNGWRMGRGGDLWGLLMIRPWTMRSGGLLGWEGSTEEKEPSERIPHGFKAGRVGGQQTQNNDITGTFGGMRT